MSIHCKIIRDAEELALLTPEWRELWQQVKTATPFQHPDWLASWWDIFAPGELCVIAIREGKRFAGFAPFYIEHAACSRLLPIGISLSDYTDVLLHPDYAQQVLEAISWTIGDMDEAEELELGELPPDGAGLRIAAPSGWQALQTRSSSCPVLSLPGSIADLPQVLSHSRLRHLRTARNRAAKRGEVAVIEGDINNCEALLGELIRLHARRWSGEGEGVFADPRVAQFHTAGLPHLMREGLVRLYALSINDTTTGVYYGFLHCGRAYAYLGGYDPEFAFQSPGAILLGHAIEQAVREGASEFHFLRGREAYKYEWGASDRWNTRLLMAREPRRRAHG